MYKAVSHAESHYQGCHRSVVAVLQDLHCICLPKSPCVSPEGSVQASEISSPTNNFRTQGVIVGLCGETCSTDEHYSQLRSWPR